jgi:hypothetical protein
MALRNIEVKKISMKPEISKVHVVLKQDQVKQEQIKQEIVKPEVPRDADVRPTGETTPRVTSTPVKLDGQTKDRPLSVSHETESRAIGEAMLRVSPKQELIMKQELELKRDEMLKQEIALEQSKIDENNDESIESGQDEVSDPGDLISVSASEIHNLVEQMKSDKQTYIEKITKLHKKIVMKDKIIENNMTLIDMLQKEIERLKTKK